MKTISIIVRIGIIALLLLVFLQEWQRSREEQLRTDLESLVESYRSGTVEVIDISAITPFAWEKLYLFGPYTSDEIISDVTGVSIKQLRYVATTVESNDSIVLFIFVNQGKIVRHMDFYRNPDFADAERETGYSPSEAIFTIDERGRAIPISQ